jgi:hypothetical protein
MDRAYNVGGVVSLRLEGGDFTKNNYGSVQSDGFRWRIVGVGRYSDDTKIPFASVYEG